MILPEGLYVEATTYFGEVIDKVKLIEDPGVRVKTSGLAVYENWSPKL